MKAALNVMVLGCASAMLFVAGAAGAATRVSEAQQRYEQERAVCLKGQSNQDRTTCLKEAGAAFAESKRDSLGHSAERDLQRNREMRCDAFKAGDHEDCLRRMGSEGVTSGSAQQGGIIRELKRTE